MTLVVFGLLSYALLKLAGRRLEASLKRRFVRSVIRGYQVSENEEGRR